VARLGEEQEAAAAAERARLARLAEEQEAAAERAAELRRMATMKNAEENEKVEQERMRRLKIEEDDGDDYYDDDSNSSEKKAADSRKSSVNTKSEQQRVGDVLRMNNGVAEASLLISMSKSNDFGIKGIFTEPSDVARFCMIYPEFELRREGVLVFIVLPDRVMNPEAHGMQLGAGRQQAPLRPLPPPPGMAAQNGGMPLMGGMTYNHNQGSPNMPLAGMNNSGVGHMMDGSPITAMRHGGSGGGGGIIGDNGGNTISPMRNYATLGGVISPPGSGSSDVMRLNSGSGDTALPPLPSSDFFQRRSSSGVSDFSEDDDDDNFDMNNLIPNDISDFHLDDMLGGGGSLLGGGGSLLGGGGSLLGGGGGGGAGGGAGGEEDDIDIAGNLLAGFSSNFGPTGSDGSVLNSLLTESSGGDGRVLSSLMTPNSLVGGGNAGNNSGGNNSGNNGREKKNLDYGNDGGFFS
jgi:hypothetical protein